MKKITLAVPQGVGDIFWIYQKFAPYVDAINFRICHVKGNDYNIQNRAAGFLKLLPKTMGVSVKFVSGTEYEALASGIYPMKPILDEFASGKTKFFNYSCNRSLEEGIRIDDIDPEFPIEETVVIKSEACDVPEEYICAYVSGSVKNPSVIELGGWPTETWFELIHDVRNKRFPTLPVILIGAYYDQEVSKILSVMLETAGIPTFIHIDLKPAKVVNIIARAKLFIGYQSGLNILADNLDTPQIMLYFKHLEKMQYTWCKKKHTGHEFMSALFDETPASIMEKFGI